ncbi:hypothetical protein HK096_000455, partial [Nowakowskiella sp. JEL0078]
MSWSLDDLPATIPIPVEDTEAINCVPLNNSQHKKKSESVTQSLVLYNLNSRRNSISKTHQKNNSNSLQSYLNLQSK